MADSVSFKAYLKRDSQEVEVRRFGIDSGAATNFMYLQNKILDMFPSIQNDQYKIFWKDSDNDYISVGSDEELVEALTSSNVQPFKLFINVITDDQTNRGGSAQSKPQTHPGIKCDGCEGAVSGYRYKCVTCPNYDLCAACEAAGEHPDHFMLRVPWPVGPGMQAKYFRKFFGRPHKFHKFARHCGQTGGFNMRGEAAGLGRCPFSRPAGSGAAPTSDMFDFSALLDFINSLDASASGQSGFGTNEPSANTQTNSNPQAPPPQPNRERSRPASGSEYLTTIGQAISAFLDPFGIDVTIEENRNRSSGANASSQPTAPSATPQPNAPSATPQPNAPSATPQPEQTPSSTSTPPREATPTPGAQEQASAPPARRNSDDWTLLNRESPTRNEAMDVEAATSQAGGAPTAPPTSQVDADAERKKRERLQEAIDTLRNMGFKQDTKFLEDTIVQENFNLIAVLEKMLNQARKI